MTPTFEHIMRLADEYARRPLCVRQDGVIEPREALRAAIEAALKPGEPVAWLSTDSIGERYLCFSKPNDNDPVIPLYAAPQPQPWSEVACPHCNGSGLAEDAPQPQPDEHVDCPRCGHCCPDDTALLRQALDALTCSGEDDDPGHRCSHCDDYVDRNGPLRAALRERLK